MSLTASILVFRHGQRPPYPLPLDSSAAGPSNWSTRPFPSAAEWGMTEHDFANQMLTPNGKQQLTNLGAYMAAQLGDPCGLAVTLIADDSARDVQSAEYFASGFLPPACAPFYTGHRVALTPVDQPALNPHSQCPDRGSQHGAQAPQQRALSVKM